MSGNVELMSRGMTCPVIDGEHVCMGSVVETGHGTGVVRGFGIGADGEHITFVEQNGGIHPRHSSELRWPDTWEKFEIDLALKLYKDKIDYERSFELAHEFAERARKLVNG